MPAPRLQGKVAIITGSAGGISAAAARRFAEKGALLVLTDADVSGARRLAQGSELVIDAGTTA